MTTSDKVSQDELDRALAAHAQFQKMLDSYKQHIPGWRTQSPSMLFLHLLNSLEEMQEWMARFPSEALRKSWYEQQKKKWEILRITGNSRKEDEPPNAASEIIGIIYGAISSSLALLGVLLKTDQMDVILSAVASADGSSITDKMTAGYLAQSGVARRYLAMRQFARDAEEISRRAEDGNTLAPEDLLKIFMIAVLGLGISSTVAIVEGMLSEEEMSQLDMSTVVV